MAAQDGLDFFRLPSQQDIDLKVRCGIFHTLLTGLRPFVAHLVVNHEGDLGVHPVLRDPTVLDYGLEIFNIDVLDIPDGPGSLRDRRLRRLFPAVRRLGEDLDYFDDWHDLFSYIYF
jgi:hypothetical protein